MSDAAFQTQFRDEFIAGFEQRQSLLRDTVTTEVQVKGNQCVFLVADSGGASAVTRGINGRIPGRPDNLNQYTCTLNEWHDKPERTGFNLFASQGDGRRIMQETAMGVMNRKIDDTIITELSNATNTTGTAQIVTNRLITKIIAILGNNKVPMNGQVTGLVTPAFMGYLSELKEFSNAQWIDRPTIQDADYQWKDTQGFFKWRGIKWVEHTGLPGAGTNAEKCFFYHASAIGHAAPGELISTYANYNEEDDYSFARCTAYMGAKLLQNSGVLVCNHDGSALVAS